MWSQTVAAKGYAEADVFSRRLLAAAFLVEGKSLLLLYEGVVGVREGSLWLRGRPMVTAPVTAVSLNEGHRTSGRSSSKI